MYTFVKENNKDLDQDFDQHKDFRNWSGKYNSSKKKNKTNRKDLGKDFSCLRVQQRPIQPKHWESYPKKKTNRTFLKFANCQNFCCQKLASSGGKSGLVKSNFRY